MNLDAVGCVGSRALPPSSHPCCAQPSSSLAAALCKLSLSHRILSLSSYHTCSGTSEGGEKKEQTGVALGLQLPTAALHATPWNYYIVYIYICITPRTLSQYFVASPRSVRCLKLFKALRGFYFVSLRCVFFSFSFFHFNFLSRQSTVSKKQLTRSSWTQHTQSPSPSSPNSTAETPTRWPRFAVPALTGHRFSSFYFAIPNPRYRSSEGGWCE